MKRRIFLSGITAIPASAALGQAVGTIPQRASLRVIVDEDFSGDPDGLVALTHQLLTARGAGGAGAFAAGNDQSHAAARAIVAEALRDDPLPPSGIAARMRVVWIGGTKAGSAEYNQSNELAAARYVLTESAVPVWQIPEEEYKRFQVSVAELTSGFRDIWPVSRWLYSQYLQLPPFVQLGGSLGFGDSAMVFLTAFDAGFTPFTLRPARRILDDGRHGAEVKGRECVTLGVRCWRFNRRRGGSGLRP